MCFIINKYFNINDGKPGKVIQYLNQNKKKREKLGMGEGRTGERKERVSKIQFLRFT